ncbi:glycine-rich cell wall structural protein 1.0-like [Stylophora pistillata]|uniref:glycine-rich cell wall structural protein 1.0-like n=1 Tax=Stylophora pistillata TaxID=50429 RepID=UPI000C0405D0|nr:glycine-rich cell wall structural protein 1.0-like [Stylophora pistillata]
MAPGYITSLLKKRSQSAYDLRAFNAVFTNLNTNGRFGPTTLGSHYTGQDHDGQVTLSSGIQQWTVPRTGDYRIEAIGAAGGYELYSYRTQYRGRGARMIGTFCLNKGEVIQILVGQEGGRKWGKHSSGGGGGTFVVRGANTPLIIAGGGGGVNRADTRHEGCDTSTNTTGNPGYKSWSGGSNGDGAHTADNGWSGGGGGGFYSSGRSGMNFNGIKGWGGEGGKGFIQGGVGGRAQLNDVDGGFGGGGGAYGWRGGGGGGGGGGYSGGSSGDDGYDTCGGGGGSYNDGNNQDNECCYNNAGHGQVTITFLE